MQLGTKEGSSLPVFPDDLYLYTGRGKSMLKTIPEQLLFISNDHPAPFLPLTYPILSSLPCTGAGSTIFYFHFFPLPLSFTVIVIIIGVTTYLVHDLLSNFYSQFSLYYKSAITLDLTVIMPKRGGGRGRGRGRKTPAVPVRGGWDVLPHNMGVLPSTAQNSAVVVADTPAVTGTQTTAKSSEVATNSDTQLEIKEASTEPTQEAPHETTAELKKDEPLNDPATVTDVPQQSTGRQLRPRNTQVTYAITPLEEILEGHSDSLPALDKAQTSDERSAEQADEQQLQLNDNLEESTELQAESTIATDKKPTRKRKAKKAASSGDDEELPVPKKQKRKARKTKDNPFGLTPGESPFPEFEGPSAEQCEEVYRLLADMHDDVQALAPEVIPAPSLEVTGCGEVPSVLDALIRTMLSGAVTFAGAAKMLQGLIKKFGVLEEGIGKGSINWNKVRLSPVEDVFEAIRAGGLANKKAAHIKTILDMVYQENIERRAAFIAEKETGVEAKVYGASEKTKGQKDLEILKTEKDILSLDHIRGLSNDEAMRQFTKYPGIGVKTAACVILFCLQQPCFAVDTHVYKFATWLRWAPQTATENDVFSHLEVRCPDHLKYGLHQLFIRHGQVCGRCKRSTVEGTEEWKAIVCPLEHLVERFGKRQTKAQPKPPKREKKVKKEVKKEEAEEDLQIQQLGDEVAEKDEVKKENPELADLSSATISPGDDTTDRRKRA
ncbi:DNA glycosylase [Biscogniauxia sp. FL1348]|nr:DNA glycosylase [Biscogniauxia sp. FL1348]